MFIPTKKPEASSLHHLKEAWVKQASKIDAWSKKWADLKLAPNLTTRLFHKLRKMLDQISFFQKKERDIISKIDALERKHRYMRENNLLRKATDKPVFNKGWRKKDEEDEDDDFQPKRSIFTALLWLYALTRRTKPEDQPTPKF